MPRVLIVADSAVERGGLEALLARDGRFEVVGAAAGSEEAERLVRELAPEVAVVALSSSELEVETLLSFREGSGSAARTAGATSGDPEVRVATVVLTSRLAEPDGASQPSGVGALLPADAHAAQIVAAVCAVAAGLMVVHPDLGRTVLGGERVSMRPRSGTTASKTPAPSARPALTARELEVLRMMADGLPNKAIAADLGITPHTVKFHIGSILSKLDAESRTEAVTVGIRLGMILL